MTVLLLEQSTTIKGGLAKLEISGNMFQKSHGAVF